MTKTGVIQVTDTNQCLLKKTMHLGLEFDGQENRADLAGSPEIQHMCQSGALKSAKYNIKLGKSDSSPTRFGISSIYCYFTDH